MGLIIDVPELDPFNIAIEERSKSVVVSTYTQEHEHDAIDVEYEALPELIKALSGVLRRNS